jgi:hypothetical protein
MTYEPCECCGRTDLDTGHGLCGFGYNCDACLSVALTGEDTDEHRARHP